MDKFLRFRDSSLVEEYKKHLHHEVIICSKHFLFFFYCWHICDFAIANYLTYRSTEEVYTYFDVLYAGIELLVKLMLTFLGFRYFLRSHKAFAYVDYFLIITFLASSVTTFIKL